MCVTSCNEQLLARNVNKAGHCAAALVVLLNSGIKATNEWRGACPRVESVQGA